MTATVIALLIKPFFTVLVLGLIVLPLRFAFERYFPEGRIKRLLLIKW